MERTLLCSRLASGLLATVMTLALAGLSHAQMAVSSTATPTTQAVSEPTPTAPPAEIKHALKMHNPLPAEAAKASIWLEAHNSPKLTTVLQRQMESLGYVLAPSNEQADLKINVRGMVMVSGIKRDQKRAEYSEIIEAGNVPTEADAKAYGGNKSVTPIVIDAAMWKAGVFSSVMPLMTASSIANWLGAQTGVAGWFNKMITGDERGWCVHENCKKWQTGSLVTVRIEGKANAGWRVESSVWHEKVVVEQMIAESLAEALKPFGDLAAVKPVAANTTN